VLSAQLGLAGDRPSASASVQIPSRLSAMQPNLRLYPAFVQNCAPKLPIRARFQGEALARQPLKIPTCPQSRNPEFLSRYLSLH